ncbi:MAG: acyl-CoA dehydrogenase family protein [Desulfobacterales bacterium]
MLQKWDADHYFPYEEAIKPMGELGFFGMCIPRNTAGRIWTGCCPQDSNRRDRQSIQPLRVRVNMQCIGSAYTIYRYGK